MNGFKRGLLCSLLTLSGWFFLKLYLGFNANKPRKLDGDVYEIAKRQKLVTLNNGIHRVIPLPPLGPKDETYLEHSIPNVNFELALDTETDFFHFDNLTFADYIRWSQRALAYRNAWIARAEDFRQFLSDEEKNNVDPNISLADSPYRRANMTVSGRDEDGKWEAKHARQPPDLVPIAPPEDPQVYKDRFKHCMQNPSQCGDVHTPPVVDIGLVLPLHLGRYNSTWPTLESMRQLVVFPKEIVFVLSGIGAVNEIADVFSFLTIVKEYYWPTLPTGVHIKAFIAQRLCKPGEVRWFGFNQTTASVVTAFDGDDYMHPQMFQVLDSVFNARPELDHALMKYDTDRLEGEYFDNMYYTPIIRHLRMRHFRPKEIQRLTTFPNEDYDEARRELPTFGKDWWLGNTDAEPNWSGNKSEHWWDYGCANGWATFRRHVMDTLPPPTDWYGGEDAIYNWRVLRTGHNYKCLDAVLGVYLKCLCTGKKELWSLSDSTTKDEKVNAKSSVQNDTTSGD